MGRVEAQRYADPPARGNFQIIIGYKPIWWLPGLWPNRRWMIMNSPPDSEWGKAYGLATMAAEEGRGVTVVHITWEGHSSYLAPDDS